MVIKAQNIITKFGEKIVHDGVSFEIKNEIFGILEVVEVENPSF